MYKVRLIATVRNDDIEATWHGYWFADQPHQLRTMPSATADIPAYTFVDEASAKAFIRDALPTVDGAALDEPGGSRFTARREYDELSGEYWTRTALIERP